MAQKGRVLRSLCAATGGTLLLLGGCGARTTLQVGAGSGLDPDASTPFDGGSEASSACRDEVIGMDLDGATALAVDGDTVFWGTTDGQVLRHDANGTRLLATGAALITSIAFDASRVYYTVTGSLLVVSRNGGAATRIAGSLGQPFALSVDQGAAFLIDRGDGIAAGRVLRIDADGTTRELLTLLDTASGLAIDHDAVYVAAWLAIVDHAAVTGPVLSVSKEGGTPTIVATGFREPSSVAVDSTRVYVVDQVDAQFNLDGGLFAIAKGGGTPTKVVATPGVLPVDVTLEGESAYLTTYGGSGRGTASLVRAAFDGSSPTTLASTPGVVYGYVRPNPTAVYWTIDWSAGAPPADGASMRKVCK